MEHEGQDVLWASLDADELRSYVQSMATLLEYSARARRLADHLDSKIEFRCNVLFTAVEHQALMEALDIFDTRRRPGRDDLEENVIVSFSIPDEEAAAALRSLDTVMNVRIRSEQRERLTVFNQEIELPPKEIVLHGVKARLLETSVDYIKVGETIRIEFLPCEHFELMYRLGIQKSAQRSAQRSSNP
jgi:hypothetical protein